MTAEVTTMKGRRAPANAAIADELASLRTENARLLAELGGMRAALSKGQRTAYWNGFSTGGGLFGIFAFVAGAALAAFLVVNVQAQSLPIAQDAVMRGATIAAVVQGQQPGGAQ